MAIGQDIQLYGLIGFPVKHSYSASMHNAAFSHLGMKARYELFEVPPEELDEFFKKTIVEKKLRGFNVTVPHKEKAVLYLNASISPGVSMNRAVNTVRVEPDGTLSGCNTDGSGFGRDLKEQGVEIAGKNAALLGAGGGAKAVATALASKKPKKLFIFDVDRTKAEALASIVREFYPDIDSRAVDSVEELGIGEASLLVNATPVGMRTEDPLLVRKEWLHSGLFVYDLIYNPAETKLLKAAKEAGCRASCGIGMLLYQGCLAFEYWTGREAPVEAMRRALRERLDA